MASPLQFAYRTQKAIGVFEAAPVYQHLGGFVKPEGNFRCTAYSPCGRFFGWANQESVTVVDASTGGVVLVLPLASVYELGFSPQGTFVITWERPSKDDAGDATKNLQIWRTVEEDDSGGNKRPIGRFVQKQQGSLNIQYTADEKYCARLVTNEVQFYESHDPGKVWNKLRVEGAAKFALAPGSENHAVAVFVPERKGQPAAVKVFNVPSFETPISQKTFFKGDKVQLKWNKRGSSLLVLAQTEVDRSGKSYYGETTLYLLSTNGAFDARVTLDKDGPIADVSWSPNSREFGVVYGYTPAKATIFSDRAVAKHSFPLAPRNTIQFSPNARFVLIGGFGNFVGQIDIFDLEKDYRKVCTIESGSPSVCAWSPDSRYLMTATTSPRLRVDNGVKIWHVSGPIMYHENMDELYNIEWRPAASENVAGGDSLSPVPTPHASAATYLGTVKTPSKPAGAYRPPGARGLATPLHFKREDEGGAAHVVSNNPQNAGPNGFGRPRRGVPGAELADSSPAARTVPGAEAVGDEGGKKNKKKRSKKANQDGRAEVDPNGGASLAPYDNHAGASDRRSPERPGPANGYSRDHRGRTRNNGNNGHNGVSRSGSHIQHGQRFNAGSQNNYQANQGGAPVAQVPSEGADSAQNLKSKKVRSLQKKIRAIEDLEMRRAGGEKLEDTQIKKINTKADVMKELVVLEREF